MKEIMKSLALELAALSYRLWPKPAPTPILEAYQALFTAIGGEAQARIDEREKARRR